jgi:hypothetical protein
VGEATVTGPWPRLRRWAWWTVRTVVAAAAGVVAVWIGQRVPWDAPLSVLGFAILAAPLYGFAFWTAHNRGWLIERCDEALDVADRALDATDRLRDEHRAHRHAVPGPERPRERTDRGPATTELPRVTPNRPEGAQPVGDAHTMPRPAVPAIPGGTRLTGATASGHGRHAAPDEQEASQ